MNSDSDSYFEENSEAEEEVAGPLHINVNIEESPESPPPASPSPVLPPPSLVGEMSPVWELPADGRKFLFFTRADVVELKFWAQETKLRRSD